MAALSVARATPPAHTPAVSSRGPPRRASSTNGLRACPRNTPPSGSPPKGHDMRTASARVHAPTKAGARPRQGGVAPAAAAKDSASTRTRTTAPYQLKERAQASPMASQPSPASHPDQMRVRSDSPARRQ